MLVKAIRTSVFQEGDNLLRFIVAHCPRLSERSIVVVTSKIVALSERRVEPIVDDMTKERLIKRESQWAMKTRWTWLTIKDHMVMSSAGVDESNANGKIILLPKDSYRSASRIRKALQKKYRLKDLGVLITDSRLLPLRAGIVGVALGYAGFTGVRDYRKTPDIFGRKLRVSRTDIADSLATAAVLEMGEGAEQQPLCIITGAHVQFRDRIDRRELLVDFRDDVYAPLFQNVKKIHLPRVKKSGYEL